MRRLLMPILGIAVVVGALALILTAREDDNAATDTETTAVTKKAPTTLGTNVRLEITDGEIVGGAKAQDVAKGATVSLQVISDVAGVVKIQDTDTEFKVGPPGEATLAFVADEAGKFDVVLAPDDGDELKLATLSVK